jgi:glycosyltransferase involved in cell wall biosynthesis
MTIDRITFFSYSQDVSALEQYRIVSPLKHAGIEIVPGIREGKLLLESINEAPLILFQRDFSRSFSDYLQVLEHAHFMGKPVVLDLDDHLLALPQYHPDRISGYYADGLAAFLHALINVDAITVTTRILREALLPYNPHIYVLPNYLDNELWHFRESKLTTNQFPVRILFVGTPTHKPDLELIAEPLAQISQKYRADVSFCFYGAEPPEILSNHPNVTYIPLQTYDFQKFISYFLQLEADIAIAPLENNLFNCCKSSIKYFEYTALGLPGVFSALPPYAEVVQDGENGFLAATPEEWERKLGLLIESPELRLQFVQEAQQRVQQNWLIQDHANEWQEVYDQIITLGVQQAQVEPNINLAITALASQLEEYHNLVNLGMLNLKDEQIQKLSVENEALNQKLTESLKNINLKDEQIQKLSADLNLRDEQIQKLSVENEGLQLEIVDYTSSTSWKITRPLRRLSRLVRRK